MGNGPFSSESTTTAKTLQVDSSQNASGNANVQRGQIGNQRFNLRNSSWSVTNTYNGLDTRQLGAIFGVLGSAVGTSTGLPLPLPIGEAEDRLGASNAAAAEDNAVFGPKSLLKLAIGALISVAIVAALKVFFKKRS